MAQSEKEKMLAGMPYRPTDPELTAERSRAKTLLKDLNGKYSVFGKNTAKTIRELLPNSSPDLYIEPPFHCDYGYNIHCGKRVYFNVNCIVLDVVKITIGSFVLFGPGVHIYTATHPLEAKARRTHVTSAPVVIGDDCWIGGNSVILPGVTIGSGSVVGASSVVTNDVPPGVLVAGNPARIIRKLN